MRASGNGGLLPPDAPRACPGRDLILRKSGRPDLRWGRAGEGGVVDAKGHGLENSFCYFK
jgi:hypothetical protein